MENEINRKALIENMADNLPMLRTKLGFTQEEIAKIIGVSRHTVISIENKKRPMTWNTYLSLVLVFSGNPDTKMLMKVMGTVTDELEDYLVPKKKEK
ncbi:MAG: helix-turn-helix domain-containing protein [Clostridia bacterium]|nr:helix-turn-helix domain-containing protein [Clostridia bacterium]